MVSKSPSREIRNSLRRAMEVEASVIDEFLCEMLPDSKQPAGIIPANIDRLESISISCGCLMAKAHEMKKFVDHIKLEGSTQYSTHQLATMYGYYHDLVDALKGIDATPLPFGTTK